MIKNQIEFLKDVELLFITNIDYESKDIVELITNIKILYKKNYKYVLSNSRIGKELGLSRKTITTYLDGSITPNRHIYNSLIILQIKIKYLIF